MAFLLKKPEVVYQRAHEFISVGRDKDALGTLYDFIKDNRRKKWNEIHEKIMLKFVELCVDSKNVLLAKDGLYHYKNLVQQTELQSLGTVVDKFMCFAEQRALDAQKISIEKIEEIGDLEDTVDIPEKMLLAAVSVNVAQDRMDRTVLSPWMRFLWEAYRNLLELFRHNVYVEQLYQQVAHRVFNFCVQYQRKGEFRRLCENLRFHLQKLVLAQDTVDPITKKCPAYLIRLDNLESLMLMLDTRLAQMDTSISLDLLTEAFKSAMDVHNIIAKLEELAKDKDKRIKPTVYLSFYDKLSLVLLKGGNTLYHVAALLQKYCVLKDSKEIAATEIQDLSNRILLAAISVVSGVDTCSPLAKLLEIEELCIENAHFLTTILRLSGTPTYPAVLKEIYCLNISRQADGPIRSLFFYALSESDPFQISEQVHKKLNDVLGCQNFNYQQYKEFILKAAAVKTMKEASFLQESLPLERFRDIIPFYDRFEFERFVAELSKFAYGNFKIDHSSSLILFEPIDETWAVSLENEFEDKEPESLGLYNIRLHIENLHSELQNMTCEDFGDGLDADALNDLKHHVKAYKKHMEEEEKLIVERQSAAVTNSDEELKERICLEKLEKEKAEAAANEERWRAEEKKRMEILEKEQQELRIAAEIEASEKAIKQKHIEDMEKNPIFQHLVVKFGKEALHKMDLQALKKEEMAQREAERKEREAQLSHQQKNFDHSVRAFHLEEIGSVKTISDERKKSAALRYQKFQADSIEKARHDHRKSILTYERLQRARVDAKKFLKNMTEFAKSEGEGE